ncbi:MAG: SO_0444 family Cu/Zn efflux transporter [Chlorobium sp.]|uniref:SO_0444 family Cu/Zn efflux transporter n=1 Tax=Chlorobium sp. TaxID=1095 RepID=UPI0025C069E7|nr:SO_0444 family Cu/Zn efflux transporter [Chlorobium sp.]MCF8383950.1 SO_0444 family Cu/Zn efflux transporter [Chlorobium sp.]
MNTVIDTLIHVLLASWNVLLESAPFVLLGFFVAGLLKAFLPDDFVARHLGGGGTASIFKAAAMGVPIPLCSCGVLPAAAGLKKQGAGKGAVTSFLISTPETGVDSIAVSWALLDPLMTLIRPVVAFFTAVAAGIAVSFTDRHSGGEGTERAPNAVAESQDACASGCCCSHREPEPQGLVPKFMKGMRFAFGDLLKDIGGWLFFGVLLAGVISVFLSPEIVSRYLSNEYLSMLLMLAISVPLYVCATASTPIAAALALKGISPGAALVFLLAGPATNAAAITVIAKLIGKRATVVYVAVIVAMSFLAGIALNALYASLGIGITGWLTASAHEESGPLAVLSAVVLVVLVARAMLPAKAHAH